MEDLQSKQVKWYYKNGRYASRITKDSDGKEYVIGDWSWNRRYGNITKCPHCGVPLSAAYEEIEEKMNKVVKA